jgi:cytochrome c
LIRFAAIVLLAFSFACHRAERHPALGDPVRGKAAIDRYGCASCHEIPGFPGAHGMVGPSLRHLASRPTLAGTVPNTPDKLVQWLQNPPALAPRTSMPNLGVTPRDASDMAAYLETLR